MYRQGNKENEPVLKGLITVIERSEKRLSTRHYREDNRFDLPTRNRFVDGPVFFSPCRLCIYSRVRNR